MSYYQSIIDRIPINTFKEINQIILHTLLLGLVAKKNVLLRYADDDNGLLSGLNSCRIILHDLFGLSIAEVELRSAVDLSTEEFLRLLFIKQSNSELQTPGTNNLDPPKKELYEKQVGSNANFSNKPVPRSSSQGLTKVVDFEKDFSNLRLNSTSINDRTNEDVLTSSQVLLISGLEVASPLIQRALLNIFLEDHVTINQQRWKLPDNLLVVYLCPHDAFERPNVQSSLLDHFAISSLVLDVEVLEDSIDIPYSSEYKSINIVEKTPILNNIELSALRDLASSSYTYIHYSLTIYIADLFSLTQHHPHLDGSLLGVQAHNDAIDVSRAWRVLFGPQGPVNDDDNGQESPIPQQDYMLDVSIDDIHAVFLRVLPHRLRVRDGPNEEILASAIIRMSDIPRNLEWRTGRRPVTEILRQIIMDHLQFP